MSRSRLMAAMLAGVVAVSGLVAIWIRRDASSARAEGVADAENANTVTMNLEGVTLRLLFGLRDKQPSAWRGQIQLSEGKVWDAAIWRAGPGDVVENRTRFQLRTRTVPAGRQRRLVTENGLLLRLDAPPSAKVSVTTNQGDFQFQLGALASGQRLVRLEGQVSVDVTANATEVVSSEHEEDFPAAATADDGTVYVAYIEHAHRGSPNLNPMPTAPKDFGPFRPEGGGDRLMTTRFDGSRWAQPVAVTDTGLDLWRPAVAVDGRGTVWMIWSQNDDGNWDLYARSYNPAKQQWSARPMRLTEASGADVNVVATRSRAGDVWLAWQGWRDGGFDIHVATLDSRGMTPKTHFGTPHAHEWSPAIAADSLGHVYVAFDTYQQGNYDVQLATISADRNVPPAITSVAASPRFEVRPSLACDAQDRLWIAWEERVANWGKDDWGAVHPGPGAALYRGGSTVRVAVWNDGALRRTAGDLLANFQPVRLRNMNGFPRLGTDDSGRLWLSLRHREQRRGPKGTFWQSYVTSYEGNQWSPPTLITYSDNLLDNRPVLLGHGDGRLLVLYSGDGRNRFTERQLMNNHLFAAVVQRPGQVRPPELVSSSANGQQEEAVTVVHPNETQDVARIRNHRLKHAGKTFQLMRGEFHRHTEISGDGGGDGSLEDMWRYGLDAARMDWIGNGDHDNGGGSEYSWWITQKTTDIFHHPPDFVPMFTYERSVRYPDGHRNVMFAQRGIRTLPRLRPQAGENKPNNVSAQDTPMLYRYLKQFDGICAVHTSATDMGTDWRDNDPIVEPIVEIYQGDRHNYEHLGAPRSATDETQIGGFRPEGFVWEAFSKGYRLGFQASSDHISTHISYAIALVEQPTREGILDAFKKRHCYGATDNIILTVTSENHLMGDEFTTRQRPSLEIQVIGTQPIARLSVIKDMKYVYSGAPNERDVQMQWTDHQPTAGKTSLYYVRVEQVDGQLAWASPMWITYRGEE